jgi:RNA processing factor Prp31
MECCVRSLSRYKLKFSPDKIDTMIVQAVCLLDDLDKELNNYIMRCREWYGWHFPELGKIITDNIAFVKTVRIIGKCIVMSEWHGTIKRYLYIYITQCIIITNLWNLDRVNNL